MMFYYYFYYYYYYFYNFWIEVVEFASFLVKVVVIDFIIEMEEHDMLIMLIFIACLLLWLSW